MSALDRRATVLAGMRAIVPFTVIAGPFGLIYGVTAAEAGASNFDAIIASFLIMGGAAQIALMELVGDDASWVVAALTPIVINLRFALYSASVATAFSGFPARLRYPLAHGLTDQATIIAVREFETKTEPQYRLWFFIGASVFFALPWWIGTTVGVLVGGDIGPGWQLPFAVPATFIALLVPSIRDRPTLVAAVVGGGSAVGLAFLPSGLNIIIAAVAGIAAGTAVAPLPSTEEQR